MRPTTTLTAGLSVALLACGSDDTTTGPEARETMTPVAASEAAAVNLWRERGPHRLGTVVGGAIGVTANAAGQSIVYAFGGCDVVQGSGSQCTVRRIAIYNVATDQWTNDLANEAAVWLSNGAGTIGGKLYVSGGYPTHDQTDGMSRGTWAYDPASGEVTPLADMPKGTAEGMTGVIGDKLYVLPGSCDANRWPQPGYCEQEPTRRLYRYDPAKNKWGARKSAPHHHRQGAAGVIGGKWYVVGGFNGSAPVAALDVYDPATDTWTTRAPIPTAGQAIGTALQGKLYVVAGSNAYVYDPGTNKWSSIAAPTWSHEGAVRVVINGKPKLLAVGGLHGPHSDTPSNTEVYTP